MSANRLENFTMETVNRKDIHGADYNPRKISESAKKKLRRKMKEWGAVQPIVVNRRTMTIVGGHQRIDAMDSILRKDDYNLTVAMIDVDEKQEAAINVFLNNPSAQGEWDVLALQGMKDIFPDMDFEADMGFDPSDIDVMMLETGDEDFGVVKDMVSEARKEAKKEVQKEKETDEYFKAAKADARQTARQENAAGNGDVGTIDYTLTIVFPNNHEKREFMRKIRKPEKEKFLKSTILLDIYNHVHDISVLGGRD